MTAAKYLAPGDWVSNPTLATLGHVLIVTEQPHPLGERMLVLTVQIVETGETARYTVDQDADYLVLGAEGLRRRRAVELDMQLRLSRELLESQRVIDAIDTQLAVTP